MNGGMRGVGDPSTTTDGDVVLNRWIGTQAVNLRRHVESLRPFGYTEFGTGSAAPSRAHIDAVNRFVGDFRTKLTDGSAWLDAAVSQATRAPSQSNRAVVLARKDVLAGRVLYVEGIWDFYFDLFVQRLSAFGQRLRAIDRIAANLYEDVYLGLSASRPAPTLLPFSYSSSGFSPFTFRRGVPLRRLRHHQNLFPLVIIPQHRLDAVWALSSVLHEVAHNLQADLGLWAVMPRLVFERLTTAGRLPSEVAIIWARWHKEICADLLALLLGGTAVVESLMDVVGRSREGTVRYSEGAVHPTPVLRVPISLVLLRRLGFKDLAGSLSSAWSSLYPAPFGGGIPSRVLDTFQCAADLVVDTMVFRRHPQLGGKALAELVEFGPNQMALIELGAKRLGSGEDLGTIPPRLMVSAARTALDERLATPQEITDHFYRSLGRR
ncbi:MAG: hypothetical protein QOF53_3233 [Nocardioidaceae bacterium]|jgi:hypothetical protein|nr:hypothetical protein [Nocardioidaceae bacterium]